MIDLIRGASATSTAIRVNNPIIAILLLAVFLPQKLQLRFRLSSTEHMLNDF